MVLPAGCADRHRTPQGARAALRPSRHGHARRWAVPQPACAGYALAMRWSCAGVHCTNDRHRGESRARTGFGRPGGPLIHKVIHRNGEQLPGPLVPAGSRAYAKAASARVECKTSCSSSAYEQASGQQAGMRAGSACREKYNATPPCAAWQARQLAFNRAVRNTRGCGHGINFTPQSFIGK